MLHADHVCFCAHANVERRERGEQHADSERSPVHADPANVQVSAAVQLKVGGVPSYPAAQVKAPQFPSGTVSQVVTSRLCTFWLAKSGEVVHETTGAVPSCKDSQPRALWPLKLPAEFPRAQMRSLLAPFTNPLPAVVKAHVNSSVVFPVPVSYDTEVADNKDWSALSLRGRPFPMSDCMGDKAEDPVTTLLLSMVFAVVVTPARHTPGTR